MHEISLAEASQRIALAKSILNHRAPSAHTIDLAAAALEGASVTDLMRLEEAA